MMKNFMKHIAPLMVVTGSTLLLGGSLCLQAISGPPNIFDSNSKHAPQAAYTQGVLVGQYMMLERMAQDPAVKTNAHAECLKFVAEAGDLNDGLTSISCDSK